MTTRQMLILGVALTALLVVEEVWRRDPERQVRASVARLAQAFHERDASGVMAEVHADYPVTSLWPDLFNAPEPAVARAEAKRLLAAVFFQSRDQEVACVATIVSLEVTEPVIVARLDLAVTGGMFGQAVPMLTGHRFTLSRASGLTGRWAIIGHDPITLRH